MFKHPKKSIRPFIQFSIEKEQDIKLPFCDLFVTRTKQGFGSSVYHKPTVSKQYINFNCLHPYNLKKGIGRCLKHRAKAICSDTDAYEEKMISFRHYVHRNNYPEPITSALRNLDRRIENNTRKPTTVCPPYIKGSKTYIVHIISGQYLHVAQISRCISSVSIVQSAGAVEYTDCTFAKR